MHVRVYVSMYSVEPNERDSRPGLRDSFSCGMGVINNVFKHWIKSCCSAVQYFFILCFQPCACNATPTSRASKLPPATSLRASRPASPNTTTVSWDENGKHYLLLLYIILLLWLLMEGAGRQAGKTTTRRRRRSFVSCLVGRRWSRYQDVGYLLTGLGYP